MFRWLHYIGVALIFISSILLLITTISAPVVADIGILKVTLANSSALRHSSINFGTFGHCVLDVAPAATDQDACFPKAIGYKPVEIMAGIDGQNFDTTGTSATDSLTNAFVLHPVACGLAFIAALLALGGVIGSLIGSLVAILAWIITLVVLVIDFVVFGIIKNRVNNDGSGSSASYSVGIWTALAAFILLFFGTIIVFITCCTSRRRSRGAAYNETKTTRRSRHSRY